MTDTLTFVDVETTGSRHGYDRLIEIAIIKTQKNKVIEEFHSLVNPETYISPYVEYMTGISKQDLDKAPTFAELKEDIFTLFEDCLFVAHNARFDYGFLKEEFKRHGVQFSAKCLCTVKLSRYFYPQYKKHSLDSLIERFGFECKNRHRAYDDAKVLWQFYRFIQDTFSLEDIEKALKYICKKPSLPPHLEHSLVETLPESPGIYIFYSDQKIPLYVGKSKNIKERILSHFLNTLDSQKEMEMCQQIKDIDFKITPGELGALLLESRLVKELQPYYNRTLKKKEELTIVKRDKNNFGYFVPIIESTIGLTDEDLQTTLGIFKNKQKAKDYLKCIAKEYNLCEKLLGVERTKNSCFSHKLGICYGACIDREGPGEYNKRFSKAFDNKKIEKWQFESPIVIEERNIRQQLSESYIFDNWRHIATITIDDKESTVNQIAGEHFDLDTYHIVKQYVKNKSRIKQITYDELSKLLGQYKPHLTHF